MNGLIMAVRRGRIYLERVARPLIWRSPNGPACPSPLQAEITRRAAVHGRAVEAYVARLLEEAVRLPAGAGKLTQDRLESTLREMAQFSQKIPALSDKAFALERQYRDHD